MIAGILSTLFTILLIIVLVGAIAGAVGYARTQDWMRRRRGR